MAAPSPDDAHDRQPAEAPRRGRPRDPNRRRAILEATVEVLLESGYSGVTFVGVARRAGVARSTLYHWWTDRAHLVQEALFLDFTTRALPDRGSLEADVEALVDELVRATTRPEMAIGLPALHADLVAIRRSGEPIGTDSWRPIRRRWERVFERARERGEDVPRGAARLALEVTLGSAFFMAEGALPGRTRNSKRARIAELTRLLLGGVRGLAAA